MIATLARRRLYRALGFGGVLLAAAHAGSVHASGQLSSGQSVNAQSSVSNAGATESALIRGDAELDAWFRAAGQVQAALDATDAGPYGVDGARWLQSLDECSAAACVRLRLHGWLQDLTYPEARPAFSIPGAKTYRATREGPAKASLKILDLGAGWRLVILDGSMPGPGGGTDVPPVLGGDVFVARQQGKTLHYRNADGDGYDLTKVGSGWRVSQAGACTCGPRLTLADDYR